MRTLSLTVLTAVAAIAGAAFLSTGACAAGLRTPFAKSGGQSAGERLDQEEAQDPRLQPFRVRSFVFRPGFAQNDDDDLEPSPLVPVPQADGKPGGSPRRIERVGSPDSRCPDCETTTRALPPHLRGR